MITRSRRVLKMMALGYLAIMGVIGWFAARSHMMPMIRHAHPGHIFLQIQRRWLSPANDRASSAGTFGLWLGSIADGLDWNSCRLKNDVLLDGWGHAVRVNVGGTQIDLWSAGNDGLWETEDDIRSTSGP